jgi:hypothetical protein
MFRKPLQAALAAQDDVTRAWFEHWRSLWPTASDPGLEAIVRAVQGVDTLLRAAPLSASTEDLTGTLSRRLLTIFRRYPLSPATAVAYLGLEAIDLLVLRGAILAQFLNQIAGTMLPLNSINNIVLVFGTASTLLYFYFKERQKGPVNTLVNYSNMFARYIMMIALGIGYTGNLSANIPRTIGQLQLIFGEWIHLIPGF